MGDEVTLPSFEASSETVSGAGVLGEFDDPTVGYFSNMELEIPFRVLDQEAVRTMAWTQRTQGGPSWNCGRPADHGRKRGH